MALNNYLHKRQKKQDGKVAVMCCVTEGMWNKAWQASNVSHFLQTDNSYAEMNSHYEDLD